MNKEIERLEFFIRNSPAKDFVGEDADKAFIDFSEKGIKTELEELQNPIRYKQLCQAKRWQGITMQMWEDSILDGSIPYWTLLGGENPKEILPKNIVDFLKKELFKGIDKETIEKCYQEVLAYWNWWRRLFYFLKAGA